MRIRNSLAILCSTVFCCSLVLTGCNKAGGKSTSGSIPEGYYEVTFETRGGTEIAPQVVKSGEKATKPANDPTNTGSTFTGWYKDFDAVTLFDFEDPITAPTTIYAGWDLDWNSFYGGQGTSEGGGGGGGSYTYTITDLPSWIKDDGCVLFAWVWAPGDGGSWHSTTYVGSTATFTVDVELTGFNLARCIGTTVTPNWEIHDPDYTTPGRVFNKTNDFTCSSGSYSYSAPDSKWVQYH